MRSTYRSLLMPFLIALACSALYVGACTKEGSGPGVDWPAVVKCGPGVDDIVGAVSRILTEGTREQTSIGDAARAELEQLALKHGHDTVACLVDLLVSDWTAPGAAANPDRMAAAARGRDFLNDVGTKVIRSSEPEPEARLGSQPASAEDLALQVQQREAELQKALMTSGSRPGASERAKAMAFAIAMVAVAQENEAEKAAATGAAPSLQQ